MFRNLAKGMTIPFGVDKRHKKRGVLAIRFQWDNLQYEEFSIYTAVSFTVITKPSSVLSSWCFSQGNARQWESRLLCAVVAPHVKAIRTFLRECSMQGAC